MKGSWDHRAVASLFLFLSRIGFCPPSLSGGLRVIRAARFSFFSFFRILGRSSTKVFNPWEGRLVPPPFEERRLGFFFFEVEVPAFSGASFPAKEPEWVQFFPLFSPSVGMGIDPFSLGK